MSIFSCWSFCEFFVVLKSFRLTTLNFFPLRGFFTSSASYFKKSTRFAFLYYKLAVHCKILLSNYIRRLVLPWSYRIQFQPLDGGCLTRNFWDLPGCECGISEFREVIGLKLRYETKNEILINHVSFATLVGLVLLWFCMGQYFLQNIVNAKLSVLWHGHY